VHLKKTHEEIPKEPQILSWDKVELKLPENISPRQVVEAAHESLA